MPEDSHPRPAEPVSVRKANLIREEIWQAAIDLFSEKGFEETTVEDIARASGLSRRSFFRYFASKGDILGRHLEDYGQRVAEAIAVVDVQEESQWRILNAVVKLAAFSAARDERTRKVFAIVTKYDEAREAQITRLPRLELLLATAFESRLKNSNGDIGCRVLASTCMSAIGHSLQYWYDHEGTQIEVAVDAVLRCMAEIHSGHPDRRKKR